MAGLVIMADFSGNDIKVYVQNPENQKAEIGVSVEHNSETYSEQLNFVTKDGLLAGETVSMSLEKLAIFRNSSDEKATSYSDISSICLEKDNLKEGAYVIAAFLDSNNLLIDTNEFIIEAQDLENNIIHKPLQKPEVASEVKLFIFENSVNIKPLTRPVLFSDTL